MGEVGVLKLKFGLDVVCSQKLQNLYPFCMKDVPIFKDLVVSYKLKFSHGLGDFMIILEYEAMLWVA